MNILYRDILLYNCLTGDLCHVIMLLNFMRQSAPRVRYQTLYLTISLSIRLRMFYDILPVKFIMQILTWCSMDLTIMLT